MLFYFVTLQRSASTEECPGNCKRFQKFEQTKNVIDTHETRMAERKAERKARRNMRKHTHRQAEDRPRSKKKEERDRKRARTAFLSPCVLSPSGTRPLAEHKAHIRFTRHA
mmetsp:Transcript_17033/g.34565  ORF Transcript_17033/g.34565 Transcript_17033/m.34565 type:complete len:111 (+) Transcript_17033:1543-1875(+)